MVMQVVRVHALDYQRCFELYHFKTEINRNAGGNGFQKT